MLGWRVEGRRGSGSSQKEEEGDSSSQPRSSSVLHMDQITVKTPNLNVVFTGV
jgi:hypothetical protein